MTVCRPCEVEAFIWLQRTAGEITTVLRILIWAEFGGSQVSKKLKNGIQGSELVNPEIYSTQFGQEMAEQALLIYESKDSLLKCIALLCSQQCWESFCPLWVQAPLASIFRIIVRVHVTPGVLFLRASGNYVCH